MLTNATQRVGQSPCSTQDIVHQLQRVLAHDWFEKSPVLSNFLRYIVEQTLDGKLASLKEYTIGVEALGRKPEFDPQTDAIVRIHAGRLRTLLTAYYTGPGYNDKIVIDVAKGSYIPVFNRRCDRQEVLKTLSLSLEKIKHVAVSKLTVAILPFRNLSPGGDHQFFVDGIGEEFTSMFSTSCDFSVIGHHSTLRFSEQHTTLNTIGVKLNAQYVMTGTVMRTENYFRINVGLAETQHSTQIWGRVFDYNAGMDPMIALRETIRRVYSALAGSFGVIVRHSAAKMPLLSDDSITFNPALLDYHFYTNFSYYNYARVRSVLEMVQQSDPQFARVSAMLSELYLWGHIMGYPTVENPVSTALQLAKKAMNADPQSGHACFSFYWASLYNNKSDGALHDVARLVNPEQLTSDIGKLGVALVFAGQYEQGKMLLDQALTDNAYHPWSFDFAACLLHFREGRYAEAFETIANIEAPDVYLINLMKTILLVKLGQDMQAKPFLDALVKVHPLVVGNLRTHLGYLLLDENLIDLILVEAQALGLRA